MKIVIFGLSISSSWGNGHATLWRGLCKALSRLGHRIVFFEHDFPYYAAHRDLTEIPGVRLILYPDWETVREVAQEETADAEVAVVTSFCPDGIAATELILASSALSVFYDMDTPVTLAALESGEPLSSIGPRGLRDFDLVLSYTGGVALDYMREKLGARRVAPLYGSVDPEVHRPSSSVEHLRSRLSYLGTYAKDRQPKLETLFLEPARRLPESEFLIAGALYPQTFPWRPNLRFIQHLAPKDHSSFYSSSRITLNITRQAMVSMGYCPSGRLFEAAACATPVMSDRWEGLETFFEPGVEILTASSSEEAVNLMGLSDAELARIGRAALDRALAEHTAHQRAVQMEDLLQKTHRKVPLEI